MTDPSAPPESRETAASPVAADATSVVYRDPFVAYTRRTALAGLTVSSADEAQERDSDVAHIEVENQSNFAYQVGVEKLPPWLEASSEFHLLAPGESTRLSLGLDRSHVPAGFCRGVGRLRLKGPFFRRSYELEVTIEVRYTQPIPAIEVECHRARRGRALHLAVRNAGGGLLQGWCYDRETNDWQSFLLDSESEPEAEAADATRGGRHHVFTTKKPLIGPAAAHSSIVVICDCVNPRFRYHEVHLSDYLPESSAGGAPTPSTRKIDRPEH